MCKETYYSEVLPYYISLGVSKKEIDSSCPAELKPYEDAMNIRLMRQDTLNWYNGIYTMSAVSTAIDRVFSGNKSRAEYIEKAVLSDMNMTEEERIERDLQKALAIENAWMASTQMHLPDSI